MGYHSALSGVFFLAFGVFERRTIFLYILSKFYHVGRGGCCAVVLGGWLLPAVAGVHKSTTVHVISQRVPLLTASLRWERLKRPGGYLQL
jgi:hypothetical protein